MKTLVTTLLFVSMKAHLSTPPAEIVDRALLFVADSGLVGKGAPQMRSVSANSRPRRLGTPNAAHVGRVGSITPEMERLSKLTPVHYPGFAMRNVEAVET